MSVVEHVRQEREELARVLKKHPGIRRIVEDLYPDSAHFIYELLQNAEDRKATHIRFVLSPNKLRFEHDGETFRPKDIFAITDIGEGTKAEDNDKIGRFGVGFKAVFAYSETPRIWSPTYSFQISDLVLPSELPEQTDLAAKTRFDFPFNNPKKSPQAAYKEIEAGLNYLAESTILFLRHIESIEWQVEGAESSKIRRIAHGKNHIEILRNVMEHTPASVHYLKFERPAVGLPTQRVAVAFALDYLPGTSEFSKRKRLRKQLRVVPAAGQVSVFFPAAKESSGLRFHLHAPFVPELSRASIKETSANEPLFEQLAALVAQSLGGIRDLGLLDVEFLGVLPNSDDQLGKPYERIRGAVITAMNNEPLTPTQDKSHAPAIGLCQARASLKDLLTPEDLAFLLDHQRISTTSPQWAAGTMRGSNAHRFMSALSIREWDAPQFASRLYASTSEISNLNQESTATFTDWMAAKTAEWHQRLYALLQRNSEETGFLRKNCRIVRLSDGEYAVGGSCCFPDETLREHTRIITVDRAVYSSGRNASQKADARKFLESLGVAQVGERQLVQAILDEYYPTSRPVAAAEKDRHFEHLARFIKLQQDDPSCRTMLAIHPFLAGKDGWWHTPSQIFLDNPYCETRLTNYYEAIDREESPTTLEDFYLESSIGALAIGQFAAAIGAQTTLDFIRTTCDGNVNVKYLESAPGRLWTDTGIDQDYTFPHFKLLTRNPSIETSKLIWQTMMIPNPDGSLRSDRAMWARFRWNKSGGDRYSPSQLVHELANTAWIPQGDEFVTPANAIAEDLPRGFIFDAGAAWIKAIKFGQDHALKAAKAEQEASREAEVRSRRANAAQELGFADIETAERAKRFIEIPEEVAEKLLADYERSLLRELPEHESVNPERRNNAVYSAAAAAPEKQSEDRMRSVRVGQNDVKGEAKQYLIQNYTENGELFCQICKSVMPFKLNNGDYYFEAEPLFLGLKRLHRQNHLALCPNHAAMFRYTLAARDSIPHQVIALQENNLPILMAGEHEALYFTKNHLSDLKAMLRAEDELES